MPAKGRWDLIRRLKVKPFLRTEILTLERSHDEQALPKEEHPYTASLQEALACLFSLLSEMHYKLTYLHLQCNHNNYFYLSKQDMKSY